MARLPVLATVADAWRELRHDWPVLVRLAWIPFLVQALGKAFFVYGAPAVAADDAAQVGAVARFLAYEIVFWLVLMPAITAWHRHVILGPPAPRVAYGVGGAELRYLAKAALVLAAVTLVAIAIIVPLVVPFAFLAEDREQAAEAGTTIGSLAGGLLAQLVMLHGLLLFPAAAVGRDLKLGEARAMLRGSRLRLMAVLLLSYAPAYLLSLVLRGIVMSVGLDDPRAAGAERVLLVHLLDTAVQYAFLAITVGALSFSYLKLARAEAR